MTPRKAKHIDGREPARLRGGGVCKLQKVDGHPRGVRFVVTVPGHCNDKIVIFGLDVAVITVACENHKNND